MRDFAEPQDTVSNLVNTMLHVDAVCAHYLEELHGYVDGQVLTPTAAQSTAMLFVFCGLLECLHPHLPVQHLTYPSG